MPRHADDRRLVDEVLRGDTVAVDTFMERMLVVRRLVHAKNSRWRQPLAADELEDVIQDTLMAVWRKLDTYRGDASLETWVYRFTDLEFRSRLRRARAAGLPLEDEPADPRSGSPGLALEGRLALCLERLPELDGEIVRMRHFDGFALPEIARRLALKLGTAKSRYYRAMERLRADLVTAGDEA